MNFVEILFPFEHMLIDTKVSPDKLQAIAPMEIINVVVLRPFGNLGRHCAWKELRDSSDYFQDKFMDTLILSNVSFAKFKAFTHEEWVAFNSYIHPLEFEILYSHFILSLTFCNPYNLSYLNTIAVNLLYLGQFSRYFFLLKINVL